MGWDSEEMTSPESLEENPEDLRDLVGTTSI